jgi:hypothetical protein
MKEPIRELIKASSFPQHQQAEDRTALDRARHTLKTTPRLRGRPYLSPLDI